MEEAATAHILTSIIRRPVQWKVPDLDPNRSNVKSIVFVVLVGLSAAVITDNILIFANQSILQDFPGPSSFSSTVLTIDPIIKMPVENGKSHKLLFHTAVTASDSVCNTCQCKIMYYWFNKFKDQLTLRWVMGGFNRNLHSGKADGFMDEILSLFLLE